MTLQMSIVGKWSVRRHNERICFGNERFPCIFLDVLIVPFRFHDGEMTLVIVATWTDTVFQKCFTQDRFLVVLIHVDARLIGSRTLYEPVWLRFPLLVIRLLLLTVSTVRAGSKIFGRYGYC